MRTQKLPEHTTPKNLRPALYCVAIVCITAIAFSPCLKNGFTNWDDENYITANPDIRGFTAQNLWKICTLPYGDIHLPLTMLSYMVDYRLFGLKPAGYHIENILLHGLNCLLVLALVWGLSGRGLVGLITSLLFAVHPLRVESVAWIAERKDVLSSFFYFISLLAYVHYLKKGDKKAYYFCIGSFLLSLLSKPMAVSQPFVLLLIDYLMHRKIDNKALREKIPFVAVAAAFALLTVISQHISGAAAMADNEFHSFPPAQRLLVPFYGLIFYLVKTIAPVHLSALYPYPAKPDGVLNAEMFLSPFLACGIVLAIFYSRKAPRSLIFGTMFFLITLLPVLQIVPIGYAMVADRYTYLPMIGIYFLFAQAAAYLPGTKFLKGKAAGAALAGCLCSVLLVLAAATYGRCGVWADSLSLWNDVLAQFPDTFIAYNNRGNALVTRGKVDSAISDFQKAIELNPKYSPAYGNRGIAYRQQGLHEAAIADFTTAIRLRPDFAVAYASRGFEHELQGAFSAALPDFDTSIALNPNFALAYFYRGGAYEKLGKFNSAIADLSKAVGLDPTLAQAYSARGKLYKEQGADDYAIQDFNKAIALNPDDNEPYCNRGLVYSGHGEIDPAIADFTKALELNPKFPRAYTARAVAYCVKGSFDLALADLDKSIALDPRDTTAHYNRGLVFLKFKGIDKAVSDFSKTIALDPKFAQAYNNRGIAYGMTGRYALALADFNRAIELSPGDNGAKNNRNYIIACLKKAGEAKQ